MFQVFAGLIPLSGAVLMVTIGPQEFSVAEYRSFRFLVTALIALGMLGFQFAMFSTRLLSRALAVLTRTAEEER